MSTTSGPGRPATRRSLPRTILPASAGVKVSPRVFWYLCASNPDLRMERTAGGRLIIMSPAGFDSGRRNADLLIQVGVWAKRDGSGVAVDSSAGFILPNGAIVGPDAAWVRRDRLDQIPAEKRLRHLPLVPDFVAEVRSPSDRLPPLRRKMLQYRDQGVRLGWLIDPRTAKAEVYRPGREAEALDRPVTLSGEDVLPGLVVDLKGILFD